MLRVVANKRVEMTNDEFDEYNRICKANDRAHFKGEDLFIDLFETDKNGIITFLRSPNHYISFEAYFFVVNLFIHQQLSMAAKEVREMHQEMKQFYHEKTAEQIKMIADMNLAAERMEAANAEAQKIRADK